MASLAATRIFAAGGAGGIALTAWVMRRAGMSRRAVADRTIVFLVLTYVVYMVGMLVVGVGLRTGVFPGPAPFGLTVVPAAFAGISIVITLLVALLPTDLQRRVDDAIGRGGWLARLAAKAATLPASMSAGVRHSIDHVRARDPAILGVDRLLGVQHRGALGVVPRVRRGAVWAVLVDGVPRRHARQPAAAAGRRRRRGRRDDRRVHRVRRRRRPRGRRGADVPRVRVLAADDPRGDRVLPAPAYRHAVAGRAGADPARARPRSRRRNAARTGTIQSKVTPKH